MKLDSIQKRSLQVILCTSTLVVLIGCASPPGNFPEPDLIPESRSGSQGPEGFCRRNDDGDLVVRVRNQTNNDVLTETKTSVVFSPGGEITRTTSLLPGGSSHDSMFPIPPGCFNPDCDFTITVDKDDQVDESHGPASDNHETNNVESGICIG